MFDILTRHCFLFLIVPEQVLARVKRGWSYPLQAVPKKFRSRKPKGAMKMTVAGNTDAKVSDLILFFCFCFAVISHYFSLFLSA